MSRWFYLPLKSAPDSTQNQAGVAIASLNPQLPIGQGRYIQVMGTDFAEMDLVILRAHIDFHGDIASILGD